MSTLNNRVLEGFISRAGRDYSDLLAIGVDLDGRGLHWRLAKSLPPDQRLEFALAVYFSHGLYIRIATDNGFLCVERIAQCYAQLARARACGSYLTGHAFAKLLDALGYCCGHECGCCLLQRGDCTNAEAFLKGFKDSVDQLHRAYGACSGKQNLQSINDQLGAILARHAEQQFGVKESKRSPVRY